MVIDVQERSPQENFDPHLPPSQGYHLIKKQHTIEKIVHFFFELYEITRLKKVRVNKKKRKRHEKKKLYEMFSFFKKCLDLSK